MAHPTQMNIPPAFPIPQASNYQSDPDKMSAAISYLEVKVMDAKKTIEELLYMLDMQEKVPWPDMLDKFSSLAAAMSQLQGALKKSAIQSGHEDHGALLRSHVLVPQRLQLEPDSQLQTLTSYRVHSWNHDVVPDYLRTKLNPEMESEEMMLEQDRNQKGQPDMLDKFSSLAAAMSQLQGALKKSAIQSGHEDHGALLRSHVLVPQRLQLEPDSQLQKAVNRNQKGQDVISKQITHLNKYVDLLLQSLHSTDRAHNESLAEKPTFNKEETARLVRATMVGEGLKINMGRSASATSSTTQLPRPSGAQQRS
ncbi:hypothetical protein OSTOST_10331 [Ostertagia ostertagi]